MAKNNNIRRQFFRGGILLLFFLFIFALTGPVQADRVDENRPSAVERISAPDRYKLAAIVADRYFPSADKVILVQSQAWADALSASNISKGKYPILYVGKDYFPDENRAYIQKLHAREIILVGGPNTISEKLEREVSSFFPATNVRRISGRDRYELAINSLDGDRGLVLTSGHTYSDALVAAPYAFLEGNNILILPPNGLTASSRTLFKSVNFSNISIIGGSLSENSAKEVSEITGLSISRISGRDRYEVSANVFKHISERIADKSAIVTSGELFSDALIAGPLSQKLSRPILLARKNSIPGPVLSLYENRSAGRTLALGGRATISDSALDMLSGAVVETNENNPPADEPDKPNEGNDSRSHDILVEPDKPNPDKPSEENDNRSHDILVEPDKPAAGKENPGSGSSDINSDPGKAGLEVPNNNPALKVNKFNLTHYPQQNSYYCGPASLQMLMDKLGAKTSARGESLSQDNLAKYLETTLAHGSHTANIAGAINAWLGQELYSLVRRPSADKFREAVINSLNSGYPLIINTNEKRGSDHYNGHNDGTYGHIIILEGYDPSTNQVIFKDPGTSIWSKAKAEFAYDLDLFVERFLKFEYTDLVGYVGN